jgi:hypothetical protein
MSFSTAVKQMKASTMAAVVSFFMMAYKLGDHLTGGGDPLAARPTNTVGRVKQSATVIAAVVIGVVAIVGIYIYDQVYTTMPTPDNNDLANSTDSVTSGFGSAMEFVPVILIVLMAVVVIGAVQRLRN